MMVMMEPVSLMMMMMMMMGGVLVVAGLLGLLMAGVVCVGCWGCVQVLVSLRFGIGGWVG